MNLVVTDTLVEHLAKKQWAREMQRIYNDASTLERAEFKFEDYCGTWEECGPGYNDEEEYHAHRKQLREDVRSILQDVIDAAQSVLATEMGG